MNEWDITRDRFRGGGSWKLRAIVVCDLVALHGVKGEGRVAGVSERLLSGELFLYDFGWPGVLSNDLNEFAIFIRVDFLPFQVKVRRDARPVSSCGICFPNNDVGLVVCALKGRAKDDCNVASRSSRYSVRYGQEAYYGSSG